MTFPNGATYTPGVKQTLTITATDPFPHYGFELTARLASDTTNGQAGSLSVADTKIAHLECDGSNTTPTNDTRCPTPQTVQFITHSTPNIPTSGQPATWQVDWTPPATNAGNVMFYLAVNAGNNEMSPANKHIHLNSFQVTPASTPTCPTTSTTPVVCGVDNGASFASGIAPGAWFAIGGLDLSTTSPGRIWAGADFTNGGNGLPTSLDGTSVTVNGKAAYVEFISPTQVNALAPADSTAAGQQVPIVVSLNGTASASFNTQLNAVAPAFFEEFPGTADNGKYLIAQHASDFGRVGKPGLFPSDPSLTTPAKAGETVIFYGSGFGPTTPAAPNGDLVTQVSALTTTPTITVGGAAATVAFAGLVPPYAGLYQFNVTLPSTLASGDQPVIATLGDGTKTQSELITIQ